ncbi:thiamine pyrophosphate-dependent enzyme [Arthrobacter sp. UYCu712]|uniref:thiamine pyrophosphate-dependent enzyme n=1 Tax=Arthrobacter sp. UYCu712 TaxID=3156340 RepID=UPI003391B207
MDIAGLLLEALPGRVVTNVEELGQYRLDRSGHVAAGTPVAAVRARSIEDVQAVCRIAYETGTPIVTRGAGTGLAGRGIADSGEIVLCMGSMQDILARNIFDSEWDLGIAGGFGRIPAVELMRQAGVVLVVGASLNMFQMRYGTLIAPDATVIQVDTLPAATHPCVDRFICSDGNAFSEMLLEQLTTRTARWRDKVPEVADGRITEEPPTEEYACDGRLNPRAFARALERILPAQRTSVQDGGHFSGWIPMYCSAPDPQAMILVGTAFQTIGLGLPAAVGAAQAANGRTTVLVTGDGGALMALPELEAMIRTVRSGIIVVFNDAAYGAELHQYASRVLDSEAMLIDEVDLAAVGRAFGAEGIKARSLADLDRLEDWVTSGCKGV